MNTNYMQSAGFEILGELSLLFLSSLALILGEFHSFRKQMYTLKNHPFHYLNQALS